jgi:hypothetical protein
MHGSTKIWLGVGVCVLAGSGELGPTAGSGPAIALVGTARAADTAFCARPENVQRPECIAAGGEGGEGGEAGAGGEGGEGGGAGQGGEDGEGGEGGTSGG